MNKSLLMVISELIAALIGAALINLRNLHGR
jgi:hypothetical protein